MKCEQVTPYLPGYSGGELRQDTHAVVAQHVEGCADCRSAVGQLDRVRAGLAAVAVREIEPPPFLVESILEEVHQTRRMPASPAEVARMIAPHKRQIASAAGTAVVAAGAAYALWRAVRGRRTPQPATS